MQSFLFAAKKGLTKSSEELAGRVCATLWPKESAEIHIAVNALTLGLKGVAL